MKIFVGWDARDELAFRACVTSLLQHATIPLQIIPLKDYELRRHGIYHRAYHVQPNGQKYDDADGRPFSTEFTFTRFSVPLFDRSEEWVVFCDADFLWRADIAELAKHFDDTKKLLCVQHIYKPDEAIKFDGMLQQQYRRKNWSSLMAFRPKYLPMKKPVLNGSSGRYLHQFKWLDDEEIGALPEEWNWLEGWSSADISPKAVHYTRGTPDMLGKLPFDDEWWAAVKAWKPEMNEHGAFPCGL